MSTPTLRVKRASKATEKVKKKTSKSFAKRFSVSGTGLIIATQSGKRHNMSQKSKKQLLRQKGTTTANKSLYKTVRYALGLKVRRDKSQKEVYTAKTNVAYAPLPKAIKKLIS